MPHHQVFRTVRAMHTEYGLRITNRTLSHLVDACVSNGYLDQAWDVAVGGGVTTHLDGLLNVPFSGGEYGAGGDADGHGDGDGQGGATVSVELYGPTLFRLVRALLADTQNQFRFEEAVEVVVVSRVARSRTEPHGAGVVGFWLLWRNLACMAAVARKKN